LSLLASYPDYFFLFPEPNILIGFEKNNNLIEELKNLENLEGLKAEAKAKIKKTVDKTITHLECLRLASFSIEKMLPDCDAWYYSKDLFLDGITEDLISLNNKKKFFKKDYLIREIIFSIIELYAFHFGLESINFELEVILKENGDWQELEDRYGYHSDEEEKGDEYDEEDW
jgi:hypothetical protein